PAGAARRRMTGAAGAEPAVDDRQHASALSAPDDWRRADRGWPVVHEHTTGDGPSAAHAAVHDPRRVTAAAAAPPMGRNGVRRPIFRPSAQKFDPLMGAPLAGPERPPCLFVQALKAAINRPRRYSPNALHNSVFGVGVVE